MPFSVIVNNQVVDIKYSKLTNNITQVRLGNQHLAQLHKLRSGWTVIVFNSLPNFTNSVDGFKTREQAVVYALRATGIYK